MPYFKINCFQGLKFPLLTIFVAAENERLKCLCKNTFLLFHHVLAITAYFFFRFFLLVLFVVSSYRLESNQVCIYKCEPNDEYDHWFAGPIFTPNASTVQPGHPGIEPVFIASNTYGFYDDKWKKQKTPNLWSIGPYVDFQAGLSKKIAFELIGSMATNFSQGANSTHLRDSIFRIGYQISTDNQDAWTPDFRILFQETFPTGKYQKLSLNKHGTDLTGQGAFLSGIHLAFHKLLHFCSTHCISIRGDIGYLIPSKVHVEGLNYYTGLNRVDGKINPGQIIVAYLTGECSISSKWNICCESFYQHQTRGAFSGQLLGTKNINAPKPKVRSIDQLIIAPEIQHTLTPNLAIVLGGATTLIGKNSAAFYSILFAVLYLF